MTINERMDYAARRKKEMNCCQAVLVAFATELGRSEEELNRRIRHTCRVQGLNMKMRIRLARPAWAYALRFMPMYSLVAFRDMFFMPPFYT